MHSKLTKLIVIRKLHGAESAHVETVPVVETFQGQTVWEGEVEVFDCTTIRPLPASMRGRTIQTIRATLDAM